MFGLVRHYLPLEKKKYIFSFILGFLSLSFAIPVVFSNTTHAAINYSSLSPKDQAKAFDYAVAMRECFKDGSVHAHTGRSSVSSGDIFNTSGTNSDGPTFSAFSLGFNFKEKNCRSLNQQIPTILSFFKITGAELYCAMGYTSPGNCLKGDKDFEETDKTKRGNANERANSFQSALTSLTGTDFIRYPGGPAMHWWWRDAAIGSCGITNLTKQEYDNTDAQYRYILKTYRADTSEIADAYLLSSEKMSSLLTINSYMTPSNTEKSCEYKVNKANSYVNSVREYGIKKAANKYCESIGFSLNTGSSAVTSLANACINGVVNRKNVAYCPTTYKEEGVLAACKKGAQINFEEIADQEKQEEEAAADETAAQGGVSSCSVEQIGWIVCPVINFLAKISDQTFVFLSDNFLQTNTSIVSNTSQSPTYVAWQAIRNIANILFIIAFLFIVFSQLTGAGISNYGVKKMLPRLVIAAILVNISFFICQLAVDISNILGMSIKGFLDSIMADTSQSGSTLATGGTFSNVVVAVFSVGVGAVLVYAFLGALVPVLLGALVALVMILFILLARQALIVILVVLSPVALVAFLLPNTEKWFNTWRKAFISLLMVFPIIALVYGGAGLASDILRNTFGNPSLDVTGSGVSEPDASSIWGQIIAAAVATLPLFVVPGLLKKSLDGISNVGGKINAIGAKLQGGARKSGAKAYENSRMGQFKRYRQGEATKRRALIQSGAYTSTGKFAKLNPRIWASNANRKINESQLSGAFGDRALATGLALQDKEDDELVKTAGSRLDNMSFRDSAGNAVPLTQKQMKDIALGRDVTDESGNIVAAKSTFDLSTRRAAMQRAVKIATVEDAHELVDGVSADMPLALRKTLTSSLAGSSAVAKAPYLGGKTLGDIEQGTASSERAAITAIRDGKVTPEVLAGSDKNAVKKLLKVAMDTDFGSPERVALKQAYTRLNDPNSRLNEKIVPGGEHDKMLQGIKSL